eukprot:841629-Prymnesium_polylepis.1
MHTPTLAETRPGECAPFACHIPRLQELELLLKRAVARHDSSEKRRLLRRAERAVPQKKLRVAVDGVGGAAREGRRRKVEQQQVRVQQQHKLAERDAV